MKGLSTLSQDPPKVLYPWHSTSSQRSTASYVRHAYVRHAKPLSTLWSWPWVADMFHHSGLTCQVLQTAHPVSLQVLMDDASFVIAKFISSPLPPFPGVLVLLGSVHPLAQMVFLHTELSKQSLVSIYVFEKMVTCFDNKGLSGHLKFSC